MSHAQLREAALLVLRNNDIGGWTKPAPRLYPHQWSWDSAFIALALALVDVDRGLRELESLFAAQWSDGRVPHIVFNPAAHDYFPGPDRWTAEISEYAPRDVATSGFIQPPVHAIALERLHAVVRELDSAAFLERVGRLYDAVLAWHRYLVRSRTGAGGLLVIYHPWESGTDNSPRWDAALERLAVGDLEPYVRHDTAHVKDVSQRPTQAEYDRYLWLVELLKAARYDDAAVQQAYPFVIGDVLMTAIFSAACAALARVGEALHRSTSELHEWSERFGDAVVRAYDPELRLALDFDERFSEPVRVETCAGLAPLLVPDLEPEMATALVRRLEDAFVGAPGLAYAVMPSTLPGSPGFDPRRYWRGPTWPVANWLFWWALRKRGQFDVAERLRTANLALLDRPGAQFAEYFEPYTAEPLGSFEQSWTAAVTLDWLAIGRTIDVWPS